MEKMMEQAKNQCRYYYYSLQYISFGFNIFKGLNENQNIF